jgi:oxygen-independent coproporphyrinogen-3 oxidase
MFEFLGGITTFMTYSLYFHIPFCRRRCHYCDFYTTTGKESLISAYFDALIKEFRLATHSRERITVHSIYFGGGTPSLVSPSDYKRLIDTIQSESNITEECEISLEANPGTLSRRYLNELNDLGFNRISLGVQSTNDFDLLRLDRIHNSEDVLISLYNAREAGFNNISLDLIFGLPWQDLNSWRNTLEKAILLEPEHFSIYSLIIEPGTPLFNWYQRGLIAEKDQDLEGEMYEYTIKCLAGAGYEHYEISNWRNLKSAQDFRCRHNLQYWRNQPYFGFGAAAHGYVDGFRTVNTPNLTAYLDRLKNHPQISPLSPGMPAVVSMEEVDPITQMHDFMWLGLRLIQEGVSAERFSSLYGYSMQEKFRDEIEYLISYGLVAWDEGERLHLTPRGVMVANQVFMQFV